MNKNMRDFDVVKVKEEDQVELKLEEIRKKIQEMKDFVFDYNNETNRESTPLLGFPTKFDYNNMDTEKEALQQLYTDPNIKIWMDNLDLPEQVEEVDRPSPYKKTILEDPTQ